MVLDGGDLSLPDDSFDAVVSRLGIMVFPHQQKAVTGFHHVLKKDGRLGLIVFSTPENNLFFSGPLSIVRRRARLPARLRQEIVNDARATQTEYARLSRKRGRKSSTTTNDG